MIPVARTEKLMIQEVGNEIVVYDQKNHASHSLNAMATRIWELCDGHNTIDDIAQLLKEELNLPVDEDTDIRVLIWLTLEELERFHLLKNYRTEPIADSNISRRKVVKTATILGGFAIGSMFPVVRSIIAPAPAIAVSRIGIAMS